MTENSRRVLIVGASAAGLRCACRLKRLKPEWRITVVEQRAVFSYAACGLPYVLSGDIAGADALRRTPDGALRDAGYFAAVKGVEVLVGRRATAVDAANRSLQVDGGEATLEYDELVLATGARPRKLPGQPDHPRVHSFHTVEDAATLHEGLAKGLICRVAIVGAGFAGCELAEAFRSLWDAEVTLIEAAGTPLPALLDGETGAIVARTLAAQGVRLLAGAPVEFIEADDDGVRVGVRSEIILADAVVVAAGVAPETGLARAAGIALDPSGAIAVDERFATSLPHVWAAGDCVAVRHALTGGPVFMPLGSLANRQGRALAGVLAGRGEPFPPIAGAASLKVFDCNVAAVGLTRRVALDRGLAARSSWVCQQDRPHYWPEARDIALHLVYEWGSRRVLGVQAVGPGDVVKRVDAAAQLLARGATLEDLANFEHAYAPPYAPALDPLAVAAFAAQNQEDGVTAIPPDAPLSGASILDVRHPTEREARPAPGVKVTADTREELLRCIEQLRGGRWLVICERGARSAEAVRWLRGEGIDAKYLGGGLRWRAMAGLPK